jgi:adenylate kinase family enzyme
MNKIVFITGAPASGKSTVAKLMAEHFEKSLHIQVDHLRDMMVKGAEMPGKEWNDEATRQFQRARSTAIYMAKLYASEGIDVFIDDVTVPAEFAAHYKVLFDDPTVYKILLLPTSSALIERIKKRKGPFDEILIDAVPWLYSFLEPMPKDGWIVLDSSDWTIEQTVQEVLKRIE